jgi:hypothetical protein
LTPTEHLFKKPAGRNHSEPPICKATGLHLLASKIHSIQYPTIVSAFNHRVDGIDIGSLIQESSVPIQARPYSERKKHPDTLIYHRGIERLIRLSCRCARPSFETFEIFNADCFLRE